MNNQSPVEPPRASVLVVEDDTELSETLGMIISERGHEALLAPNGRAALQVLERHTPSLILLDLVMPVMTGGELLKVLREDPRMSAIPRVVMTSLNDLMIGIKEDVEVMYKPIDEAALNKLLARHIQTRH